MTSAEIARGLAIAQGLLREYVDTLDGRQLEDTQADEITLAQAAVEAAFQEQCGETMRKLREERDDALELHVIADGTKIRPACDWPGNCRHQLTSHRKKN